MRAPFLLEVNMAAYMGKDGLFNIGAATVAYIDSWTLNGEIVTPEITGFGNSSKAYGSAIRGWTISGNGTLDRSDTDQADLLDQFEEVLRLAFGLPLDGDCVLQHIVRFVTPRPDSLVG